MQSSPVYATPRNFSDIVVAAVNRLILEIESNHLKRESIGATKAALPGISWQSQEIILVNGHELPITLAVWRQSATMYLVGLRTAYPTITLWRFGEDLKGDVQTKVLCTSTAKVVLWFDVGYMRTNIPTDYPAYTQENCVRIFNKAKCEGQE